MKFKKRILSEEIGLPKSNRKTFTKNKKQKVVLSENQLQRLLSRINEKEDITPIEINRPPNPLTDVGMQDPGGGTSPKMIECFKCEKGFPVGNRFTGPKCPPGWTMDKNPCEGKKCRKCCKPEGGAPYGLHQQPGQPCACPKSHPEVDCKTGKPIGGGILPDCCYRPDGTLVANDCNSCRPPNSCSSCTPISESRTLKTTNPITESEVKDMKNWFNRINKAGNKYNPSII